MRPSEWSKAVIRRDVICCDCGSERATHARHIVPPRVDAGRAYLPENGEALCLPCWRKRQAADRFPVSRAKKRAPHRKTLLRMVEHLKGAPRAHERISELEREVRKLKATIVRLRLRLAGRGLTPN